VSNCKSASWVKWRELSLSYLLKFKSENIGIESITFTGTGRNLWWTEDKTLGQDPETNLQEDQTEEDYNILIVQTLNL
jgi:hypothetical protein